MKDLFNLKQINFKKSKGILQVTLRDREYNPVYKSEARINDRKDVNRLMGELSDKGCDLTKNWLKCNAFDKIKRRDEE